jgi:hypothetical protein
MVWLDTPMSVKADNIRLLIPQSHPFR